MKKNVIAFGIVLLFFGLAVQPGISTTTIKEYNMESEDGVDARDFLFKTIIEMANDPEIKKELEQIKNEFEFNDFIENNFDSKNLVNTVKTKNPLLYYSILLNKPSITYDYLDFADKKGIELIRIIGEEKAATILYSLNTVKHKLLDNLSNIVVNNNELNSKITKIKEINSDPSSHYPLIICTIIAEIALLILFSFCQLYIVEAFLVILFGSKIMPYFDIFYEINVTLFLLVVDIADFIGCIDLP